MGQLEVIVISTIPLYITGHSFIRRSFTPRVVAEFSKVIDDAYSKVKVAGKGVQTVPWLGCQLRDIERFGASVVITDIGTNDLSPSSLDPKKLPEDIVEYLREISELPGMEAVVILTITPRSEETPAKSRHRGRSDFEEARLAVRVA